jgi:hypothetical protein
MSHLDRDDRQIMLHSYRQIAEILALFRTSLIAAGIPRWVAAMLVLRQFDMMARETRSHVVFIPPPYDMEEEE